MPGSCHSADMPPSRAKCKVKARMCGFLDLDQNSPRSAVIQTEMATIPLANIMSNSNAFGELKHFLALRVAPQGISGAPQSKRRGALSIFSTLPSHQSCQCRALMMRLRWRLSRISPHRTENNANCGNDSDRLKSKISQNAILYPKWTQFFQGVAGSH